MPESIDWPPSLAARPRRRRRLLLVLGVLAAVFFGGRTVLSSYVDLLWFRSLGYGDVFWKTLSLVEKSPICVNVPSLLRLNASTELWSGRLLST